MNNFESQEIRMVPLASLKQHPENIKYFKDIEGEEWTLFLDDVRENGITEPLTVDENTSYIIKGNQRYRAASVLQMEEVPCIVRTYADEDEAIDDLIRDNVMRRGLELLDKYKLVSLMKKRIDDRRKKNGDKGGENAGSEGGLRPRDQICQMLVLHPQDISAALAIESLSPSEKAAFFEWINKANPSKKNIYEQIRKLKAEKKQLEKEHKELKKTVKDKEAQIKDLAHLEEEREKIRKDREVLNSWNENDPEIFAGAKYFDEGMNCANTTLEVLTETLVKLKDLPMNKDAAQALSGTMKQVIDKLDEYRDALFKKFIAVLDEDKDENDE